MYPLQFISTLKEIFLFASPSAPHLKHLEYLPHLDTLAAGATKVRGIALFSISLYLFFLECWRA
jgi:hypothetical protein